VIAYRSVATVGDIRQTQSAGPVLSGLFAVHGQWAEISSSLEGHFLEQVAPGAFTRSLRERKPKVLLNHGTDALGKTPIGRILNIEETREGMAYEAELFSLPPHIIDGLKAGEYGASFRFETMRDEFVTMPGRSAHNPKGLPERTLVEAVLHEFGPCTFGAYSGATAKARSLTDLFARP
jgi:HK97 family phage prohead protease